MIETAQADAREAMACAGDWLTGAQRIDAWDQVRDAKHNSLDNDRLASLSPNAPIGVHDATDQLSAAAVEVLHRVASDPGRLTKSWAAAQIAELEAPLYTELVGITAVAMVLDRYELAMTGELSELPTATAGQPTCNVPSDVGDVGAWVPQTVGPTRANVSRTLSCVPVTNATWRALVDTHYSRGSQFQSLTWDRPLSRPQVELVAARVASLNECFY